MTEEQHQEPEYADHGDVPWQRLSPYTVVASTLVVVAFAVVIAIVLLVVGVPPAWVLSLLPLALILVLVPELLRWQRTRYRLTTERLEFRTGILVRAATSVPRDRIRSVDVTADVVRRVFGIAVVKVWAGQHVRGSASELQLDSLAADAADRLRAELLRRDQLPGSGAEAVADLPVDATTDTATATATGTVGAAPGAGAAPEDAGSLRLATWDPGWVRYAPMGILTPMLGVAAIGALFQVGDWFQQLPWQFEVAQPVVQPFRASVGMLVLGLVLAALVFLVVGAIGATAIWIETWWNYRLEYGQGVFRVRRGLLTSRSISFEEARMRGAELVEAITLRRFGVGQPNVVATGMETQSDQKRNTGRKALMPPAPVAEANAVIARVLDEERSPLADAVLTTHPTAARRRRLLWGLGSVAVIVLPLVVLGLWLTSVFLWIALVVGVLGCLTVPGFAVDAYRNLGHAVHGRFLVSRHGTVMRRTVGLQRSGVIGWKVSRSFFQRRAGIATVTATTAAGSGKYAVYDAELGDGLDFADEAVPGLLAPFLERDTTSS